MNPPPSVVGPTCCEPNLSLNKHVKPNYDGQIMPGSECGLNFLTFIFQLRKTPPENLNKEGDPIGDRTRARWMRGNDLRL